MKQNDFILMDHQTELFFIHEKTLYFKKLNNFNF